MKKIFAALLILAVLLSFAACKAEEQVTIYVPEMETTYEVENGEPASVAYLLYEKGWEKKDSFTVSYSTDGKTEMEDGKTIKYGDKHITIEDDKVQSNEYMDEHGKVISQSNLNKYTSQLTQTVRTFDKFGRIETQTTSTGTLGGSESYLPQVVFTCTETEQGSEVTGTQNGYTETYVYDKNYQVVSYIVHLLGTEYSRTDYTYDEHGNMTSMTVYSAGEFSYKTVVTYKAVQVGISVAQRLPNFKRDN